jgi:hypothetical protein
MVSLARNNFLFIIFFGGNGNRGCLRGNCREGKRRGKGKSIKTLSQDSKRLKQTQLFSFFIQHHRCIIFYSSRSAKALSAARPVGIGALIMKIILISFRKRERIGKTVQLEGL